MDWSKYGSAHVLIGRPLCSHNRRLWSRCSPHKEAIAVLFDQFKAVFALVYPVTTGAVAATFVVAALLVSDEQSEVQTHHTTRSTRTDDWISKVNL